MTSLPVDIYSVATVREIDRAAIEGEGIAGYTLMTRAGAAALSEARRSFPDARRWQVVCGAGNNAGDGYVVARLAASKGIVVSVLALVDPESLQGDAASAYVDFVSEGGTVSPWAGQLDSDADLVVDALLGSGLERDVDGDFALAVAAINAHPADVVALDLPTGLHGDSGAVLGFAVRADLTVTFVGLKAGLSGESYLRTWVFRRNAGKAVSQHFVVSMTITCIAACRHVVEQPTKAILAMCWLSAEVPECQVR
jgi:NAD(P)H-hydrate epimerase